MTDEAMTTMDAYLREHLRGALDEALRSVLPEFVQHAIAEAGETLTSNAHGVERTLRNAMEAAARLDDEIEDLALRAYGIEHSLKTASTWVSYLEGDIQRARSR